MNLDLNPIEKHKSQIERRISMLNHKFKEKEGEKHQVRRCRQYADDQNKMHPEVRGSKTMELRGKIRPQGEGSKIRKEPTYHPAALRQPLREAGVFKQVNRQKQAEKYSKEEKMSELYGMLKLILDGQKNLQKEISNLKEQQQNEKKYKGQHNNSFMMRDQCSPLDASLDKVAVSKDKSNRKESINQSILLRQTGQAKEGKISKQKRIKQKKQFDFEGHLQDLRKKGREGERAQVSQEWKSKIWAEVEGRVKDSEKQYKDTIHRNTKHEYDHLISTFELQRKLKDDLLNKIYDQCNKQTYK